MVDRIEVPDAEQQVDVRKALARPIEDVGEVGAVHHGVGRAEPLAHDVAERQAHQRPLRPERDDIDGFGLKALGGDRLVEAELVEHMARVRADLHASADFLHRLLRSITTTVAPNLASASASVMPAIPAPAM